MSWIRDRALTIVLMAMFGLFLAGQVVAGFWEFNEERAAHHAGPITITAYLATGHLWESVFENWESEFLQMAVFILLTTCLVQRGSPESRRPHMKELVDADPRDFADSPDAPWPVRRGGWILKVYENSLGLAVVVGRARLGRIPRLQRRSGGTRAGDGELCGLPGVTPFLVRVVPELAERVPVDCHDGVARRVFAAALLAGVKTGACAASHGGLAADFWDFLAVRQGFEPWVGF
jgi:hypothetical protein